MLYSKIYWKELQTFISTQDVDEHISYPEANVQELMVSYGLHNSTQSYGGGVVVIYRYESKPCDGIGERGHVYICNDQSGHRLILSKKNIVKNVLFKIWYR